MEFFRKAIQIYILKLGENHPMVAMSCGYLGSIYAVKYANSEATLDKENLMEQAIEYFNRSLKIYLNAFGYYHPVIGDIYNRFADLYFNKTKYIEALTYYQKAILSLYRGFIDSTIYVNPVIPESFKSKKEREAFRKKINSMPLLLDALVAKASVFERKWNISNK